MPEDLDKFKDAASQQDKAQLAMIDDLTGLFNRRFFYEALKENINKAHSKKEPLTLVMVDCDYFKDINDTYGHGFGDKVLIDVGKILKANVRNIDLIARYGGDEFVVILPKAGADNAMPIARRLRQKVAEFKFTDPKSGQTFNLSLSLGLAVYPEDAKTAQELFNQADKALYSSKKAGRDKISQIKDVAVETEMESQLAKNIAHPKFIDRQEEIQQLRQFLEVSKEEKTKRIILLNGEMGVGKTRLIEEFRKEIMVKDFPALFGICTPQESLQSYGPIIKAINEYLSSIRIEDAEDLIGKLDPSQRHALGEFIGPVADYIKEKKEAASLEDADRRYHLFHGLFQILIDIARKKPAIVFLDNFHWADSGTLNLLRYFILSTEEAPLIFIGAYSKRNLSELDLPGYTLFKFIQDISKFQVLPDIEIKPLPEEVISDFVEFVFPKMVQKQKLVDLLKKITKGNPLFFLETILFLVERKIIFVKDNMWDIAELEEAAIPGSFDKLMEARLKALDQETREVLANASGIGQDFGYQLLSKVEKTNEGHILDQIDKAKKAHMIESATALSDENFYFFSEGVRSTVLKRMDDKNKREIHMKLGQIIEEENRDNLEGVAGKLAHYFKEANLAQKAQDYTARALKKAQELFTSEDALRYLEEAWHKREEHDKEEEVDTETAKSAIDFIRAMLTAIRNIQFYPERSEIRKKSEEASYSQISEILKNYKNITIGQAAEVSEKTESRLLLNGKQFIIEKKDRQLEKAFLDVLRENEVNSITFKSGANQRELIILFEGLARKKENLKRAEDLVQFLGLKGVSRIKIDAIKYRRIFTEAEKKESRKKFIEDMVITEALFDERQRGAPGPGQVSISEKGAKGADITIEEVKKGKEKAGVGREYDDTRRSLKDLISGLGKEGKEIFDIKTLTISKEEETVLESLLLKLPDEAIIDTIVAEYKRREGPILDIKFLINKLLAEQERRKRLAPLLEKRLKEEGLSEEGFEWIIMGDAWGKLPFGKKINMLLSAEPKFYIEIGFIESTRPIFAILFSQEKPDLITIEKIVDKLLQNFKEPSWKIRQHVAKSVLMLAQLCVENNQARALAKIFQRLKPYIQKERQNEVLWFLIDALKKTAEYSINNDMFDVSFDSLKILSAISRPESEYPKESKEKAAETLKGLSTEEHIVKLARKFEEVKGIGHKEIAGALVYLGEGSIDYLIDILMRTGAQEISYDAFLVHSEIVDMLKKIGGPYLKKIKEQLISSNVWHFVRNLVIAIGLMKDEASAELLKIPLKNKDIRVRLKTIYTLSKIGGKKALEALLISLEDKDVEIKNETIKAIAAIGDPDAIPALEKASKDKKISKETQKAIEGLRKKK